VGIHIKTFSFRLKVIRYITISRVGKAGVRIFVFCAIASLSGERWEKQTFGSSSVVLLILYHIIYIYISTVYIYIYIYILSLSLGERACLLAECADFQCAAPNSITSWVKIKNDKCLDRVCLHFSLCACHPCAGDTGTGMDTGTQSFSECRGRRRRRGARELIIKKK